MAKKLIIVDDTEVELQKHRHTYENATVIHPKDLTLRHLEDASLILLDQHLDGEHWPERSMFPLACQPMTGVAVAGVIRSHLRLPANASQSATAVAVLTANLDELVEDRKRFPQEALAARAWGLDWAFSKSGPEVSSRVMELLGAVRAFDVHFEYKPSGNIEQLARLLKLPKETWAARSEREMADANPPFEGMHLFKEKTALLRWFSQRVLPYPCFLIDIFSVAARLGVDPSWLTVELSKPEGKLSKKMKKAEYRGPLSKFMGTRWWSAGVGSMMVRATSSSDTSEMLVALAGAPIGPEHIVKAPVVRVVDEHFVPAGVAHIEECEQVRPEDWPSFADSCWRRLAVKATDGSSQSGCEHE